jgi:hypothetical protein
LAQGNIWLRLLSRLGGKGWGTDQATPSTRDGALPVPPPRPLRPPASAPPPRAQGPPGPWSLLRRRGARPPGSLPRPGEPGRHGLARRTPLRHSDPTWGQSRGVIASLAPPPGRRTRATRCAAAAAAAPPRWKGPATGPPPRGRKPTGHASAGTSAPPRRLGRTQRPRVQAFRGRTPPSAVGGHWKGLARCQPHRSASRSTTTHPHSPGTREGRPPPAPPGLQPAGRPRHAPAAPPRPPRGQEVGRGGPAARPTPPRPFCPAGGSAQGVEAPLAPPQGRRN